MKYKATNINYTHTQDVEVSNEPTLTFDEIAVHTSDGNFAFINGAHFWNRLLTNVDMTPYYGQWFNMESDDWKVDDCIVCIDGSIFFRNATKKGI